MSGRPDLNGRPYRRLRQQAIRNSGGICMLCGKPMRLDLPGTHRDGPTFEHIIPVNRGGSATDPNNAGASHLRCNAARHDRLLSELPRTEQPSRRW